MVAAKYAALVYSSGENDDILHVRAVELHIGLELAIGKVSLNCNLMRTGHELVLVDGNGLYIHASSSENIQCGKSFCPLYKTDAADE